MCKCEHTCPAHSCICPHTCLHVPLSLSSTCLILAHPHTQATYSGDGVFISLGLVCSSKAGSSQAVLADNFRSAIYAYSKTALYAATSSGSSATVNAAVYVVAKSWYRSVSVSSSVVLGDSLNNFAQPARPQTLEDVYNGPYFVQKVSVGFEFGVSGFLGCGQPLCAGA